MLSFFERQKYEISLKARSNYPIKTENAFTPRRVNAVAAKMSFAGLSVHEIPEKRADFEKMKF